MKIKSLVRVLTALIVFAVPATLVGCGDATLATTSSISHTTGEVATHGHLPCRVKPAHKKNGHNYMTDFTALNSEAQKLIDAQKNADDATIANLQAQLAACQGSNTPPPATPTLSSTVTGGTEQATLSWTVANGPIAGLTAWQVSRDGTDIGGGGPWSTQLAVATSTYTFLTLTGGTTYNISIAPVVNGVVGTAVTKSVTPTAGTPPVTPPPPAATPNSISDAGFTYAGTWNIATAEHWTSTIGATATVQVTAATGGSTFALRGKRDSSNGSVSVAIDGGTAVSVSEAGTTTNNATLYTSPVLAAGAHTIVVKVTGSDGSVQGADLSNGVFTAPSSGGTTPPPPTGTSGSNTTGGGGGIIGGAANSSQASGYNPPTADAFPGYTQTISQDFGTAAAEGQFGTKYPGWNGYDGIPDGNVQGLTWESAQISAANGVLTLRNSGGKAHCQAITPIIPGTGAWNVQAQKYGKYVIRFKSRGNTGYKIAFLLWPSDGNWNSGEVDFPEGNLVGDSTGMTANSHNVTGNPVDGIYKASGVRVDDGNWHTATMEWDATSVKFAMDGTVFSTVTNTAYIPSVNMRWDLQVETSPDQATGGTTYVDIDWMAQYKKN